MLWGTSNGCITGWNAELTPNPGRKEVLVWDGLDRVGRADHSPDSAPWSGNRMNCSLPTGAGNTTAPRRSTGSQVCRLNHESLKQVIKPVSNDEAMCERIWVGFL
jgi:hypothetical protein